MFKLPFYIITAKVTVGHWSSGRAIDHGIYAILFAMMLGVLAEIGKTLTTSVRAVPK